MFLFAIITAVIGSTEQPENRLANTCWEVSWNNNGPLIGIEKIDRYGHLSRYSNLPEAANKTIYARDNMWAPVPKKLADYDGKTPTVIYYEHSLQNIPRERKIYDIVGHYDIDNKIVWEQSWWRFTTWTRRDCLPESQTINHNNENRLIKAAEEKRRLIKAAEEEKAKDANAWTENSHEEIHESGGVDSNESNNPGDIKYESRQN
jgi:hypothetical protein